MRVALGCSFVKNVSSVEIKNISLLALMPVAKERLLSSRTETEAVEKAYS